MRISSIKYNDSLVDGPGIRTVIFFQGCDLHCKGCHNPGTWNPFGGKEITIDNLVIELKSKCFNKKITMSGGEPLMQKEELKKLIDALYREGFNIALYTGHSKKEVPIEIIKKINYLKTGIFIDSMKTGTKPFVGSSNQIFEEIKHETVK